MTARSPHFHVSHGLAGYGPESDELPTFESLSAALEYARDELDSDVDSAHEWVLACIESESYKEACETFLLMERLENLRANLDPERRNAPLYVNDDSAYAALQQSQLDLFPVDVNGRENLYVWECEERECVEVVVPESFPVRPIDADDPTAVDVKTCGECGLSWDDSKATSYTPAPSARCPFESFHRV